MAALGGQDSRDAGLPSVDAVANRAGDATTLLGLSGSPLEKTLLE
jgi:hypothetical protein